jgi:adenylate kinase family enzyme
MDQQLRQALAHVLWIGGGTDTGKTTISEIIAARYAFQLYHYDQHDLAQVKRLRRRGLNTGLF